MSVRAVAVVVAFMLVVAMTAYVALHNPTTLNLGIQLWGDYRLPVYAVIAWSFVLGFAMTAGLVLVRSGKLAVGRWREAREARARERLERRYAQGLEALLGGHPERAMERFREVLGKDPDHVETLMTYGEMLRSNLGRGREAADLHRRAADLRPGDMRPLFALASDWSAEGNLDKAREALEMVIAINPRESLKARRELRELLMGAKRWDEAARVHDTIESHTAAGRPREHERRIGLGIRYELARVAQARGALREAEKECRAILRVDPSFVPASLALGEILIAQGNAEDGLRVWRRAFETTQSPVFFSRLEDHHLSREEPELLINLMRALVDGARSQVVPAFFLGKLYLRLEMIDEAEATFNTIQSMPADSALLRYYSGLILERRGRLKEAVQTYRRVIQDSALLRPRYLCSACKAGLDEAAARCPRCGDWSTIDIDVRDLVTPTDLGPAPPTEWAAGA